MCLGIPGKVVEITDGVATVDVGGTRKEASLMLLEEATLGDYVIVHAGFAIEKIDEAEAERTLAMVDELIEAMHLADREREAAAASGGFTKNTSAFGSPMRRGKFRFEVDTQRSPSASTP